jgi:hypothetical protein
MEGILYKIVKSVTLSGANISTVLISCSKEISLLILISIFVFLVSVNSANIVSPTLVHLIVNSRRKYSIIESSNIFVFDKFVTLQSILLKLLKTFEGSGVSPIKVLYITFRCLTFNSL